jgi:hypothetical protein
MAFVVNDRVQEFTSTTGTGTLTLTGSPDGFETFSSAVGNGNTTYYTISSNTTEFEVGIGTVGAGTLSRDTVISSSNSDALVNFSAGTKNVFVTLPASKTILLNDSDTVDLTGNLDLNSNDITGTGNINITGNLTASGNLTSLGIDDNATSTAITIDSSENVGIGTNSPSAKLEVQTSEATAGDNYSTAIRITNSFNYGYGVGIDFAQPPTSGAPVAVTGAITNDYNSDNNYSTRFYTFNSGSLSEKMRIDANGNVGIGVSSPERALSIFRTSTPMVALYNSTTGSDGGDGFQLQLVNDDGYLWNYESGGFTSFGTANTERMRINHLGNVGIGTTAPDAKLSVNGVASFGDGTALLPSIANFGDLNTGMWFPAADTIAFSEGGVEAMRIDSSGRVGIGTASPDALLTVDGIASFGAGAAATPSIAASGDLNTGMFFPAADVIGFSTGGGQRMRINSDGNVGIGTSSPLYKLDVPSVSGARFSKSNVFLGKEVTIINSPGQTKTIEIATAGDAGAYFKVIITGIYVPGSNLWSTYEYEKVYVNSLAVGGNSAIYTVFNQSVGSFQFQAGDFVISRPGSGVVRIVYTENASNNGNIYLNVNVIGLGGYGVPSAITIT